MLKKLCNFVFLFVLLYVDSYYFVIYVTHPFPFFVFYLVGPIVDPPLQSARVAYLERNF